jgi:aspartyl-tRNA(Asn)/glutamyl-tRNA(Gln) amidotransferase subunit A
MTDLTRLLAHEMADRLRSGEVSSRELTEAHLDEAEAGNRALNAWLTIDRDEALDQADAADARLRARPIDAHPHLGVPIALKDRCLL